MSHLHERQEKVCLNCGAPLVGRYCHDCGQENVEPKETVWHLLHHFLEDITHFDGKLFNTAKLLLFKPGFLTQEYMAGRRMAYLNPIRMYLFVSAIYFLLFYSFLDIAKQRQPIQDNKKFNEAYSQILGKGITVDTIHVTSVHQYDSLQHALTPSARDGYFTSFATRRMLAFQQSASKDMAAFVEDVSMSFVHAMPKVMFITMPFFALFLYWAYYKRRKEYYYVAHGIFTLHYFTTQFIIIAIGTLLGLIPVVGMALFVPLCLFIPVHMYLAMRRFYKEGWFKTFRKFIFVQTLYMAISIVLLALYVTGYILSAHTSTHITAH